jgi:hypothetical protein
MRAERFCRGRLPTHSSRPEKSSLARLTARIGCDELRKNLSQPCNRLQQLSSTLATKFPRRGKSRAFSRRVLWETTGRRRASKAANPDQERTVVSPDSRDKARAAPDNTNRVASPDNNSLRKVAKARMKQTKTIRSAIASAVFPSVLAMITDGLRSPGLAGTSFCSR